MREHAPVYLYLCLALSAAPGPLLQNSLPNLAKLSSQNVQNEGPTGDATYCTAFIMSKIGRYMATTMPPTTTPRNTIITGSMSERSPLTAASTSSS
jgi:hypothetical protein